MIEDPKQQLIETGDKGLRLTSLDDLWRFASCIHQAGLAPKGLESPEGCVIALQLGLELGLSPMQSIQDIAVINGRPSVYGDAFAAILMSSALFDHAAYAVEYHGERLADDWTCLVQMRRLPNGQPQTKSFSYGQAKQAGLLGRDPWKKYPDQMLYRRAFSLIGRSLFPDVLKGIYTREELQDIPLEPISEIATQPAAAIEGPAEQAAAAIVQNAKPKKKAAKKKASKPNVDEGELAAAGVKYREDLAKTWTISAVADLESAYIADVESRDLPEKRKDRFETLAKELAEKRRDELKAGDQAEPTEHDDRTPADTQQELLKE